MTMWLPDIEARSGPRYLAIADALADDIRRGVVTAGTRLPTHRELAYQLGVTVGTVSRAYGVADRKGLTHGEVGRGTYVRDTAGVDAETGFFIRIPEESNHIDFGLNMPAPGDRGDHLAATLADISRSPNLETLLGYETQGGLAPHCQAAAGIMRHFGVDADAERITICNGAQHAVTVAMMAVTRPGDTVAVEPVTYPAIKGLASHLGLKLEALSMDGEGIIPESFEKLCETRPPRALYCLPTLQNPTTAIMPDDRRRMIADIARRFGVVIIEDDVLGFLLTDLPTPIAMLAPDITYFVSGVSKCLAPGLRTGYVLAPPGEDDGVRTALNLTSWMAPPLMSEVVRRWLEDGIARELMQWHRDEVAARQDLIRHGLGADRVDSHPGSYHVWLKLPEPWRAGEFTESAKSRGVTILPAETFATGRGRIPEAVRICLGSPSSRDHVAEGVRLLAALLGDPERRQQPVF